MTKPTKDEAPVTVLCSWCLRWNKAKDSIVIYGRRLVDGSFEERFWRTSSVVKAYTPVLVITRHRSIYSLVGELNWKQSNLSSCTLRMFSNGFPLHWKSMLLDNHNLQQRGDIDYSDKIVYGNCSSIDVTEKDKNESMSESRTVLRQGCRTNSSVDYNWSLPTRNDNGKGYEKNVESLQPSRCCGRRRRRGQTEAEKLLHSLRYTGWHEKD